MERTTYTGLSEARLKELLEKIRGVRIGLLGDLCVDLYWLADMKQSELSRETPHFPLPVVSERYSLGAGGNAAANLAALQPAALRICGVVGDDWRGDLVLRCLAERGLSDAGILRRSGAMTNAYCKPLRRGISDTVYEDPRLDFSGAPLTEEEEEALLERLRGLREEIDVLCVSDQFRDGCVTPRIREAVCEMGAEGLPVVVDSRDRIGLWHDVILKPNEVECARAAAAIAGSPEDRYTGRGLEGYAQAAELLRETLRCRVSVTLGSLGNLQVWEDRMVYIPAHAVRAPIDIVGAGDTFLSGYTAALAAGAAPEEAGQLGALASEVTIRKLGQTGTATAEEILRQYRAARETNGGED